MATLKEYLEKVALRLGSAGGRAGSGAIVISNPASGGSVSYTAPADGVIVYHGTTASTAWGGLDILRSDNIFGVGTDCDGYLWTRIALPVRKGETYKFTAKGNLVPSSIRFFKSLGGGLKPLIYKLFPEVRHAYA